MPNYWERTLRQRITRRRAIVASGSMAAGTALLAACGGGDGGGDSGPPVSDLVSKAVDTTKSAKMGGVFKAGARGDGITLDPAPIVSGGPGFSNFYNTLTNTKPGVLEPSQGEPAGDLATSWEISSDNLQITMKLQPNAKWDARAPTNSRPVDAEDVVFSWERYSKTYGRRQDMSHAANPAAPVESITAVDSKTIRVKLAFPDADILTLMAAGGGGNLIIVPKETDSTFDIRSDIRGSGRYVMKEYRPSIGWTYTRNPNYWEKDFPFVDEWNYTLIPEYATGLAQFKAGALYLFPENFRPEDVIVTKKDVPDLRMVQTDTFSDPGTVTYGFEDEPASHFRDVRLRQAYSMALDRDLWLDTFYDTANMASQGLPVTTAWNSILHCHDAGWWLDPQSKDFGENAKYYKQDIAEAKKLISAAGFPNGFETNAHFITTGQYGRNYVKYFEVMNGMVAEAGIRTVPVTYEYLTGWGPSVRDAKGHFNGIGFFNVTPTSETSGYNSLLHSKGSLFKGFSDDGRSTFDGDPALDDMVTKIKREFDRPKRFALAHEMQRYVAKTQYYTRLPGGATGFDLAWPVVGNFLVHRGGSNPTHYLWVDPDKAPLKRA